MAKSLDSFIADLRSNTDQFEAAYRKKAAENPERYPLEIGEGNEGLWLEFFLTFIETGEA